VAASLRTLILIALLAALTSCKSRKGPPPDPEPEDTAAASALQGTGIVSTARVREMPSENLTRDEAQVSFRVLRDGVDVTEQAWIELLPVDAPADTAPAGASHGGDMIAVPVGDYRAAILLRAAETAVGQGGIARISLGPAQRIAVTVEVSFATGSLLGRATNRGQPVDDRTTITLRTPGSDPKADPTAIFSAGRTLVLPTGEYTAEAVWRPDETFTRTTTRKVTVSAGRTTTFDLRFDLALGRLRLNVRDTREERDLGSRASVIIRNKSGVAAKGRATFAYTLVAGVYDVHVTYAEPPLILIRKLKRNVRVPEGGDAAVVDIPLALEVGSLTIDVGKARDDCSVKLRRADDPKGKPVKIKSLKAIRLPAGAWDADIRCGKATRALSGLVIAAGDHLQRKVVLRR